MSQFSRRDFLKRSAATAAGIGAASVSVDLFAKRYYGGKAKLVDPGRKMNIACIGCGGKGRSDMRGVSQENIVAMCDVDSARAAKNFGQYRDVPKFKDYRKMLADMGDKIDAVTISTPDHMHFPMAMLAMQMGKHVFVQKPCAHTVWETRQMAAAAKKYGVITQMGNQGHASEGTRLIYEWIHSGAIGNVTEVHTWTNRPIWPQGIPTPKKKEAVPESLDWNLWLGTAPERPYSSAYVPFKWRGWWDFGCGALGDIGCHSFDAAFWALDLRDPEWIDAKSDVEDMTTTPKWGVVTYQFPQRGDRPPVKLFWYEGKVGKKIPEFRDMQNRRKLGRSGTMIVGEKGSIKADMYNRSARIVPEEKMREVGRPPKMLERVPKGNHYQEWIDGCKGGKMPGSNLAEHAGPLTEMTLLGNVALRLQKKVYWDAKAMKCTNAAEADRILRHPYREF